MKGVSNTYRTLGKFSTLTSFPEASSQIINIIPIFGILTVRQNHIKRLCHTTHSLKAIPCDVTSGSLFSQSDIDGSPSEPISPKRLQPQQQVVVQYGDERKQTICSISYHMNVFY